MTRRATLLTPRFREDNIQSELKGIIQHPGKQGAKESTGLLQAWVRINFDQPWFKILINHEIVAKYLKLVPLRLGVESVTINAFKGHLDDGQYLFLEDLIEVNVQSLLRFDNVSSLAETKLITFFKFSVILILGLYCVICQVDKWLVYGLLTQSEFKR